MAPVLMMFFPVGTVVAYKLIPAIPLEPPPPETSTSPEPPVQLIKEADSVVKLTDATNDLKMFFFSILY